MHLVLLPAVLRLLAISAIAAVAALVHATLAWRARSHGRGRTLAAWLVPGVGAVLAWQGGARGLPVAYALLLAAYVALRALP